MDKTSTGYTDFTGRSVCEGDILLIAHAVTSLSGPCILEGVVYFDDDKKRWRLDVYINGSVKCGQRRGMIPPLEMEQPQCHHGDYWEVKESRSTLAEIKALRDKMMQHPDSACSIMDTCSICQKPARRGDMLWVACRHLCPVCKENNPMGLPSGVRRK